MHVSHQSFKLGSFYDKKGQHCGLVKDVMRHLKEHGEMS